MVKLTLFSLDALIDVPMLMANAFVRVLKNDIDQPHALSLLAQKQCDERKVARFLAQIKKQKEEVILTEFYRHLPTGAHTLVFDNAYELLTLTNQSKQGIFYGLPQKTMQEIVRNANFVVDYVYGARGQMTTQDVAREAGSTVDEKDLCYIVGSLTTPSGEVQDRSSSRRLRASQFDLPVLLDELAKEE